MKCLEVEMIRLSELQDYCDNVFSSFDELPEGFRISTYEQNGRLRKRDDLSVLLANGKEWAYEFLLESQPRTAKQLLSGSDFKFVTKLAAGSYNTNVVQEMNGQIIEVGRQFLGYNSDDTEYQSKIASINENLTKNWGYPKKTTQRQLSLPESIHKAYYHRIDGLRVPDSPAFGAYGRILPFSSASQWESIDGYLGDLRLKKKFLPVIEEMIPDVKPAQKNMPYTNFSMFLNSWGSFTGKKKTDGDHLFVKNHIQDGVVYYIRDADVANMMILADPAEAIDQYCEHVLLRKEGRFDFRPWAVPFASPSV
jgi:hypothetical protein